MIQLLLVNAVLTLIDDTLMIHLSRTAIAEISRMKSKYHNSSALFRLGIQPGGCFNFYYTLGFDETLAPGDQVWNCGSIQVVVDSRSLVYINGTTLDYTEDLMGGGFRFHNPNTTQSCGCGNSFSTDEHLQLTP